MAEGNISSRSINAVTPCVTRDLKNKGFGFSGMTILRSSRSLMQSLRISITSSKKDYTNYETTSDVEISPVPSFQKRGTPADTLTPLSLAYEG